MPDARLARTRASLPPGYRFGDGRLTYHEQILAEIVAMNRFWCLVFDTSAETRRIVRYVPKTRFDDWAI